ncbi:ABC transporter, ATP-binding protein [Brevundimonas diminuta 470-4]|nr:ABC transporter, ATP-binding protein [Brevundimonas diminuta 470-4]
MMRGANLRQAENAECGLVCLAVASAILGGGGDLAEWRRRHPGSGRGATLSQLSDIAGDMGMSARPVRCELEELKDLRTPAILHWGFNHFVVLRAVHRNGITIHDPAKGTSRISFAAASKTFTGVALELGRAEGFTRRKERSPLNLFSLMRWTRPVVNTLVFTLLISLLLQLYVLVSPLYMQLAIDEAALKGDRNLLTALALGFGLLALFDLVANALRSVAIQKVSALVGWDMTGRLFHHFLRLPLPWYQRRKLADTLSRFDSINPIRQLLSNGLVGSIIDGLLSLTTIAMMFVLQWQLALVVLAATVVLVTVRVASIPLTMRFAAQALVATIAEDGKRIETARAIQSIKAMGAEAKREADWANTYAETVRANQKAAIANIGISTITGALDALSLVVIIYLGAAKIIDNAMSVGMLYAFVAYRGRFTAAAQSFFETLISWRVMDLHSERVAEIALTPVEAGLNGGLTDRLVSGGFELKNLVFRYANQQPPILRNVNAVIQPGEFIAITGPSGSGKSTLMKVLCGLYPASAGQILLDGVPLEAWGARPVRRAIGLVLQDDELLAGTIADNVAFFDDEIDMDRVWECLREAALEQDIRSMPMRADTLIGDMGSTLSGGQKQRLLLARALYKRPRILMLDEATSHLDLARESEINQVLKMKAITRIVVAHRQETIAAADRVFHLLGGELFEARRFEAAVS